MHFKYRDFSVNLLHIFFLCFTINPHFISNKRMNTRAHELYCTNKYALYSTKYMWGGGGGGARNTKRL